MIGKIKNIRAFTLIELLMVISIISLLSSMVLGYVGSARAKSRDTVRLSDMQQINTAASMYRDDKNEAPDSIETLVNTGYLPAAPKDPSTGIIYSSRSISTSKGKVFMASTTYETIKREDGENQNVGVVVGDLTLADICVVLAATDSFPNCSSNSPTDQIVGVTSGSRKRGDNDSTIILTGLVWSSNQSQMNWYEADAYCKNTANGYKRLPTKDELEKSLTDQFSNEINDPGGFIEGTSYWSGDQYYDESSYYVFYYFNHIDGSVANKSLPFVFRCVK